MLESVKKISRSAKMEQGLGYIPSLMIVNGGQSLLKEWTVPMRSQPLWHLYWNQNPGGALILPDQVISLQPDLLYLLPPHLVFATESYAIFTHAYIDFRLNDSRFSMLKREIITYPARSYGLQFQRCLQKPFSVLHAGSLILALLAELPPKYFYASGHPSTDPRILTVLEYISQSLKHRNFSRLDNHSLSRKAGMSQDNFQHLFSREMKISPRRYILNQRLDLARIMLKTTALSIEEISEKSGFANRYQFSRSFSEVFHIPPAKFRKHLLISESSDQ